MGETTGLSAFQAFLDASHAIGQFGHLASENLKAALQAGEAGVHVVVQNGRSSLQGALELTS